MGKKIFLGWGLVLVIIVTAGLLVGWQPKAGPEVLAGAEAVVYREATCGCCEVHERYIKRAGVEVQSKVVSREEMRSVKERYDIPDDTLSCHTSIIDGYVVEGHIPSEAIEKLITEQPDIDGIAMAGMPIGSPGMPGTKTEPFVIYFIEDGQSPGVFIEL